MKKKCDMCHGTGEIIDHYDDNNSKPCPKCKGNSTITNSCREERRMYDD